jgi:2,4-dienoyl-CoA reductase-like NADH-dependent reductase (Old Yellow Enzyme family)
MHRKYPHVFNPIQLGPVEIENRFYFAPHGVGLVIGNEPADDFAFYSAERARGGCGLVINSLHVHGKAGIFASPYPQENIASFEAMAAAVHREGGKIFGQLWYHWLGAGQWWPWSPPRPVMTPSPTQTFVDYYGTHGMRREELRTFIDAFRQSATHLRQAGYDGIEVHASHGTLLEQMLSPYFNQRTDDYGGSLENRLRLGYECLSAVRDAAGDEMAIGLRFNCDELLQGGYGQTEAAEILGRICSSGLVDFVDLDVAVEPNQFWLGMPSVFIDKHPYRPYVEAMRGATGDVPVLSVLGRLTSVAEAEEMISAGVCDMVGAARALIAEPDLVRNARDGNEGRSRTCIACNWCMESQPMNAQGCSINPASYRERLWGGWSFETVTATRSKVVVVGGGPGGLEAARVAAHRGHDVVLFESRSELGGGLRIWATLPGREWYQQGVDWYAREVARLGVDVRLGAAATVAGVLAEQPDAVIIATGSTYSTTGRSGFLNQPIAGHDRSLVLLPEDILMGDAQPSGKVIIIDGEGVHVSLGIAEMLGQHGAEVEVVTANFAPVAHNLMASLEVGFVINRLHAAGVTVSTQTWARSIGDGTVTLYNVFTEEERVVDDVSAVVLATSRVPHDPFSDALEGKVPQIFPIGDALAPRPMAASTYEGQMFARFIGEADAPSSFNDAYWPEPDRNLLPKPAAVLRTNAGGVAITG